MYVWWKLYFIGIKHLQSKTMHTEVVGDANVNAADPDADANGS